MVIKNEYNFKFKFIEKILLREDATRVFSPFDNLLGGTILIGATVFVGIPKFCLTRRQQLYPLLYVGFAVI